MNNYTTTQIDERDNKAQADKAGKGSFWFMSATTAGGAFMFSFFQIESQIPETSVWLKALLSLLAAIFFFRVLDYGLRDHMLTAWMEAKHKTKGWGFSLTFALSRFLGSAFFTFMLGLLAGPLVVNDFDFQALNQTIQKQAESEIVQAQTIQEQINQVVETEAQRLGEAKREKRRLVQSAIATGTKHQKEMYERNPGFFFNLNKQSRYYKVNLDYINRIKAAEKTGIERIREEKNKVDVLRQQLNKPTPIARTVNISPALDSMSVVADLSVSDRLIQLGESTLAMTRLKQNVISKGAIGVESIATITAFLSILVLVFSCTPEELKTRFLKQQSPSILGAVNESANQLKISLINSIKIRAYRKVEKMGISQKSSFENGILPSDNTELIFGNVWKKRTVRTVAGTEVLESVKTNGANGKRTVAKRTVAKENERQSANGKKTSGSYRSENTPANGNPTVRKQAVRTVVCDWCKKAFDTTSKTAKCCSNSCKGKRHRAVKKAKVKT